MFGPINSDKYGRIRPPKLLILMIVRNEKKYGYEILKELREIFDGIWEPKTGVIYPWIKKLNEQGLLTSETVDEKEYYGLSEEGKGLLLEVLPKFGSMVFMSAKYTTVVTDTMNDLDLEISKIDFHRDHTPEERLAHLKKVKRHLESEMERIDGRIKKIEEELQ